MADTSRFGGISDHSGVWAKPALNPKSYRGEAMPKPRQSPAPQIASGVRFMAIITKPRVRVRLYGPLEVLEPLPLEKKTHGMQLLDWSHTYYSKPQTTEKHNRNLNAPLQGPEATV